MSFVEDILAPDTGGGWLAGGWVTDPDGARSPSVWASRDGRSWRRTTLPPAPSSEPRDGVYRIARRGNVTVALGDRFQAGGFQGNVKLAAWRRTGGRWTALTDETSPVLSFAGRIVDVTSASDKFFALGASQSFGRSLVQIFESADGAAWSVHSTIPVPANERFAPAEMIAVGERLIVVGEGGVPSAIEGRIMVWDGDAWTQIDPRVSGMTGSRRIQVASVRYVPRVGFAAGGLDQRGGLEIPAAWFSSDGTQWSRLPDTAVPPAAGASAIHMIAAADGRFRAVGNSPSGPLLWRSVDGRRWTMMDTPKKPHRGTWENVTIAATASTTMILLAGDGGSDMYRRGPSGSWSTVDKPPAFPGSTGDTAELRGVAALDGRVVAIGKDARGRPLVLASRDARSWTRVPLNDPQARLEAIAGNRHRFVIAGWRLVRGRARLALWTSDTGRTWRVIGGTALAPIGAFVDVEPDGRGFALAASEGSVRGLQVTTWSGDPNALRPGRILGLGEARGICVGPGGATVVAVRGQGGNEQIVAWTRNRSGDWAREPQIVATASEPHDCAGGPDDTVIVGSGSVGSTATMWRKTGDAAWVRSDMAITQLPSALFAAVHDGRRVFVTGQHGVRGQIDLALWRSDRPGFEEAMSVGPVFIEPGYQAALALTIFRGKLVLVGRRGTSNGAIWVGPTEYERPPLPNG